MTAIAAAFVVYLTIAAFLVCVTRGWTRLVYILLLVAGAVGCYAVFSPGPW